MAIARLTRLRSVVPSLVVALAVVSAIPVSQAIGQSAWAADVDRSAASGNERSETRQPGSFSRVALGGPFDVEIRQGTREAVTLRGDDNLLSLIETTIEGDGPNATLNVRFRKGTTVNAKHIAVVVEMVRVDAIVMGGVGDVVAKGLKTGKLTVTLGGVGKIDLSSLDTDDLSLTLGGNGNVKVDGRATTMKLSLAGKGSCETDGLAANDVTVTIAGNGDAHVRADKSLHVTIAGHGNVVYRGDALLSTTVFGNGSVRKG
jgi:hypothetical protein